MSEDKSRRDMLRGLALGALTVPAAARAGGLYSAPDFYRPLTGGESTLVDGGAVAPSSISTYEGPAASANLPAAVGGGKKSTVINSKNSTGNLTVAADGSDTIDGAASLVLLPGASATLADSASGKWTTSTGADAWAVVDPTSWTLADTSGIFGSASIDADGWITLDFTTSASQSASWRLTDNAGDLLGASFTNTNRGHWEYWIEAKQGADDGAYLSVGIYRSIYFEHVGAGFYRSSGWRTLAGNLAPSTNYGTTATTAMRVHGMLRCYGMTGGYPQYGSFQIMSSGVLYNPATLAQIYELAHGTLISPYGGDSASTEPMHSEVKWGATAAGTKQIVCRLRRRWIPEPGLTFATPP